MEKQAYKTKKGITQFKPVLTVAEMSHYQFNSGTGFCLACGAENDGVDPDCLRGECEVCEAKKVYGIEELMVMGLVNLVDESPATPDFEADDFALRAADVAEFQQHHQQKESR
ncbi:MAG TPA: hypothetical protein VK641_15320 [Terriglobales bacterium]|nr:hypothetical protein [Terriglobales bacterium]